MFLKDRLVHYAVIAVVGAALHLTALGRPSLWDIDEGKNGEAAREMFESNNWVLPTFNFEPRFEKPVLLYWLQALSYSWLGVNELSVRFPGAIACCLAGFFIYELGRHMFDPGTGLLAALTLESMALFSASARFGNPDAILNTCTLLTLSCFWFGFSSGQAIWLIAAGASAGLSVLAKGPVGVAMPCLIAVTFLIWTRKTKVLRCSALLWSLLAFLVVAAPWYIWIGIETKGAFLKAFFLKENIGRFLKPMEHHGGSPLYYLGVLVIGLAPWSVFLVPTLWYALGRRTANDRLKNGRNDSLVPAYRFLWCWIAVYLVVFSFSGTKLPNYVLPAYPALALLTARFLQRWSTGTLRPPGWIVTTSFACLFCIGLCVGFAFLMLGKGLIPVKGQWKFPGMEVLAALGLLPMLGAVAAWWFWYRSRIQFMLACTIAPILLFVGLLFVGGSLCLDRYKAPRALVAAAQACDDSRDIRIGAYQYFQPSLVFYCQREVKCLDSEQGALEFLHCPLPVFLLMPSDIWESVKSKVGPRVRLLGRHTDVYRQCEIVIVGKQ
jgi:4-amino-4-deoxy-L-arabinose transferase-like glycosyltransferase